MVCDGLCRPRPKSYLLQVPPGTEVPDLVHATYQRFNARRLPHMLCAELVADAVRDERALVEELIRSWLEGRPEKEQWTQEVQWLEELAAPQRLSRFGSWIDQRELKLFCFIRRFGQVFRTLSSELLAVLRELEHERVLTTVNAAPLPYEKLYRDRQREESGFSSDYGQAHILLKLGAYTEQDGLFLWKDEFALPLDSRLARNYFQLAFDISGGLPVAFEQAVQLVPLILNEDVRPYQRVLRERLPDKFRRLLASGPSDSGSTLVEAVARVHVGATRPQDYARIQDSPWGYLLLSTDTEPLTLLCEALGSCALKLLGAQPGSMRPEDLYENGLYGAAEQLLRAELRPCNPLLPIATRMLALVFGDAPKNLYFDSEVPWKQVRELALQGLQKSEDPAVKAEFAGWARIAEVHGHLPPARRDALEDALEQKRGGGPKVVEDAVIHLGVRLLAATQDPQVVTAGQTAIPLLEDVVRHYTYLVLDEAPSSRNYTQLTDGDIEQWWPSGSLFRRPTEDARLGGAALALYAAVVSARRGHPLFTERQELARAITAMETRNTMGHHVTSAGREEVERLLQHVRQLLNRMCEHGKVALRLEDVKRFVQRPRRFLEG